MSTRAELIAAVEAKRAGQKQQPRSTAQGMTREQLVREVELKRQQEAQAQAEQVPGIKQSIEQNQGMARQQDFAQVSLPSSKKARNPVMLNTLNEIIQGATFGYSDEASAAAAALVASGLEGADFADAYNGILEGLSREQEAFRDEEKALAIGGQVVGGLASGGAGLAKTIGAQAGKGVVKKALATGVTGAAGGAAAGSGFAEQGEKLEGAGKGAAAGLVVAPIAAATGAGLNRGFQGVKGVVADKRAIKKILQERASGGGRGDTQAIAAGFKLNNKGKVIPDAAQRAAMNQGVDAGTVSLAAGANKTTRRKMRGMVNLMQKAKGDKVFASQYRTDEILGNSLKNRVSLVAKANKIAGINVSKEAEKLTRKSADFSGAIKGFEDDLSDIGVSIVEVNGKKIPDFNGAQIEFNATSKKAIANIIKRIGRLGDDLSDNAKNGHELKKLIDDMVTYGKVKTGLAGKGESVLKGLRTRVDGVLDDNFPDYKRANDLYSKTIGSIDDMQAAAGSKINITGENAQKGLGTLARGITSNNRGRTELITAMKSIEKTAQDIAKGPLGKKYPSVFKSFDDDMVQLGVFSQELQKRFGVEAGTSVGGIMQNVANTGAKAATGDTFGMAADVGKGIAKKISGQTDDKAFNALKAVLKN